MFWLLIFFIASFAVCFRKYAHHLMHVYIQHAGNMLTTGNTLKMINKKISQVDIWMRHLSYILLIQNKLCTYLCLVLSFVHCVWLVTMHIHYVRWSPEDNPWGVLRIKVECRDGFTPTPTTHTHGDQVGIFFLFSTFFVIIIMVTNDISVALYHIIMYQ